MMVSYLINRCDELMGFGLELNVDESEVMTMSVREADEENSQLIEALMADI